MVMMSPQMATTKPAPAESRSSRSGTMWPLGAPRSAGSAAKVAAASFGGTHGTSPGLGGALSRIKDLASVEGVRSNQILGYGIVVGLNGTGDTLNNAPFTKQSLQAMLERMGVNTRGANMRTANVAAVMVTANLPPFSTQGTRVDVTVSAMGDAKSLQGGTLNLEANTWQNSGNALGETGVTATVHDAFTNQGKVLSQQGMTVHAASANNSGMLAAKGM